MECIYFLSFLIDNFTQKKCRQGKVFMTIALSILSTLINTTFSSEQLSFFIKS